MPIDVDAAVIANTRLSDDYNVLALAAPAIARARAPGSVRDGEDVARAWIRCCAVRSRSSKSSATRAARRPASRSSTSASASARRCSSTTSSRARGCRWPRPARTSRSSRSIRRRKRGWSPAASASRRLSRWPRRWRARHAGDALLRRAARADLFYVDLFERLGVDRRAATEDGSARRAVVTAPLDDALAPAPPIRRPALYVCGPTPMMRAVARSARRTVGAPRRVARTGDGLRSGRVLQLRRPRARHRAPHFVASCIDGPVFDATPHRLGGAGALMRSLLSNRRLAHARQPAHRRQRLLRLRRRIRRRRRPVDARRRRGQGTVPRRARRPSAAAHRRDAVGHAERDRPAGDRRPPVRREKLPELRDRRAIVIVNICGTTIDEYVELARILSDAEGVAALELNISCPNIKEGGITFGCSLTGTYDVVSAVRKVTTLPVIPEADAERHRRRVVRARPKRRAPTPCRSSTRSSRWRSTSRRGGRSSRTSSAA